MEKLSVKIIHAGTGIVAYYEGVGARVDDNCLTLMTRNPRDPVSMLHVVSYPLTAVSRWRIVGCDGNTPWFLAPTLEDDL